MSDKTISIPNNVLEPVNQRMFVYAVKGDELVTESKIIKPPWLTDNKGNIIYADRYFVVDIDPTCVLYIEKGLRRGDEVVPFIPEGSQLANIPKVFDWGSAQEDNTYYSFHESEIAGIIKNSAVKIE